MAAFDMLTKIDEMCKKYDRKDYPGIAIGVVENDELIFCKGYGVANLEYDIPIDGNTVFHVGSITKQFTATCIALLIEEGKLSLDQDIRSIFPQIKDCGNKVTISNLLHMTNGLPDVYDTANFVCGIRDDGNSNRNEFWKYVTACDWAFFKPGERWSYGNTGYYILGQIVEAVTKIPFSQYAEEHIFKPLGMNNTFIRDDYTKIIKNRAVGYSNYDYLHFNDSNERYCSRNDTLSINEHNVEGGGAGQLWTTVRDFYLWDKNLHNNILGKHPKELIEVLTTSGLLNDGKKCGYGYGLFIGDFHGNKLVHHGGLAGGYSAYYAQLPEKKLSVIVLANHTNLYHDIDLLNEDGGLTNSVLKLLIGYVGESDSKEENESAETNINQVEFDLDLSGKYMDPISSCIWNIIKKNNTYYVEDYSGNSTKIYYYGDGVFKSVDKKKIYKVVKNDKHLLECIQLLYGKIDRKFYPFCGEKIDDSELKVYEGSYYCEKIGVSYNVKIDNDKLFISNENRHNNAVDLYYTPAIRDTFISVPNKYIPYYCMTFSRDSNNEIISFSYRDDEETLRENFVFVKMGNSLEMECK